MQSLGGKKYRLDLHSYLIEKRRRINVAMNEILPNDSSRIVKAMKHSLMARGKRIRPILCIASAEAVGGSAENVMPAACALEIIHTYSLIHDDLPAMDNDDIRRGQPTCHVAFDEATAILAGDALLTLAFQILSSVKFTRKDFATKWLNVINIIASAAGYNGMVEGQARDIASEGVLLNLDELENMHLLKTGALIKASICCGAILGNGSTQQIESLENYAKNVGLAFQVADDILNVEGDPVVMGKSVGTDAIRQKNSYPSFLGIEESKQFAKQLINNALTAINCFDYNAEPLRLIANYIVNRSK